MHNSCFMMILSLIQYVFMFPGRLISCFGVTGKNRSLFFASDTQSGTPSDTQSGTPSDTPSCTKMMGDLAVMVLAASDG
jgi:hypothetical protein